MTPGELARILPRINKSGGDHGCWIWTGAHSNGYGQVQREGTVKLGRVHRLMYEHYVGPIGDGLTLDHLCRVRACVNPLHLEPVTNRENLLRGEGLAGINARKTHCPKGHELAGDNLFVSKSSKRECRTCMRVYRRDWLRGYRRRRQSAALA